MSTPELIEQLLELPDIDAQKRFLGAHNSQLDDALANELKEQANRFLRADVRRSQQTADLLLYMGELTGNPLHQALGLLAEANTLCIGGLGEYERAIELYDEAADIYEADARPAEQARSQIGKLYALAFLGRYEEALETGEWASYILEEHAQWYPLATITLNLGLIQGRLGNDTEALAVFDRAAEIYRRLGEEGEPYLPRADGNRAIVLRNLGRFEESIAASHSTADMFSRYGQSAEAARARQNLAVTYFVLGRYNEALSILDEVREVFVADGRRRDAILVELFISDCLLQLRRFPDVLKKCLVIREQFAGLGLRFEVGQVFLNEAVAHAGLGRYDEALLSLAEAREIFIEELNQVWIADTDLEMAALHLQQAQLEESLATAEKCASYFHAHSLPVREAQAHLIAARAAMSLGRPNKAAQLVDGALAVAESKDIPSLKYQARHLAGTLARAEGHSERALAEYDLAIQELERLRGRLMVEYRVDFLEDKQAVYEDVVCLHLDGNRSLQALEYAERAKSRALLDLIAYRLDLSIQARQAADRPLVESLMGLRAERDRWYRRWEGREEAQEEDWADAEESRQRTREEVLALERQITDLWHKLLIRNADYARDASLWQVRTEPVQPYLSPETALLEYFVAHGEIVAFAVTQDSVQVRRLSADLGEVQRLILLLWMNLRSVPGSTGEQISDLAAHAQGILRRLHGLLVAPVYDALAPHGKLSVVPHGPLHYVPFHALHNGRSYLLEGHTINYLPCASVLRYCREMQPVASGALALGHSYGGLLPHAVEEARAVAALLDGRALVEGKATLGHLRNAVPDCRVVHFAAHGEFRPDNPLFSGLALADGWLTTLDVFNMRLKASLVTLSACQTGQHVVGGGDELLGLLRALLHAGTASVVLSLWMAEDRPTAQLMEAFYRQLVAGWTKASALRYAQRQLLGAQDGGQGVRGGTYSHPYYWAPFCLVGDDGVL